MSVEKKKYAVVKTVLPFTDQDEEYFPDSNTLSIVTTMELTDYERRDMENKLQYKTNITENNSDYGDYYSLIEIQDTYDSTLPDRINVVMQKYDLNFINMGGPKFYKEGEFFNGLMKDIILGNKYKYEEVKKHNGIIIHPSSEKYVPYYMVLFNVPIDTKEDFLDFVRRIWKCGNSYLEAFKDRMTEDEFIIYID